MTETIENQAETSESAALVRTPGPILFTSARAEEVPSDITVFNPSTEVEPSVIAEILNFKQICRESGLGITGIQFQCRNSVDDEVSNHGYTVYDTRYLNAADGCIHQKMQNAAMWNRIAIGRLRMHRLTAEEAPFQGMYYWRLSRDGVFTDKITRLGDSAPETEGTVLDSPEESYVVGG